PKLLDAPDFTPVSADAVRSTLGPMRPGKDDFLDREATFKGAFNPDPNSVDHRWMDGWTSFPEN
ncbi:MAG: hypothetical protein AAGI01_01080, partial [Myxococcota bacterium]